MKDESKYGIPLRDFDHAADNNPSAILTKQSVEQHARPTSFWCGTQSKMAERDIRVLLYSLSSFHHHLCNYQDKFNFPT